MARKKTALLKTDLEDLVGRIEASMKAQLAQIDKIAPNLSDTEHIRYYQGVRAAVQQLDNFVELAKAEYLKV